MAEKNLVLAIFENETAADNAATALEGSGVIGDAMGILALDRRQDSSRWTRSAPAARAKAPGSERCSSS